MFYFLIPLLVGFSFNLLSASTFLFFQKFGGERWALRIILFRDVLGIPVWAAGFWLAAIAPSPDLLPRMVMGHIIGWILIAAGGLIIVAALPTIRRRALAPSTGDGLARSGMYARVRHPIHAGTFLEFAGLFLVRPSAILG